MSSSTASMHTYTGETPCTYPWYRDVTDPAAPKTLDAEPGGTYAIQPVDGQLVSDGKGGLEPVELPVPPDGHWKPATKTAQRAAHSDAGSTDTEGTD